MTRYIVAPIVALFVATALFSCSSSGSSSSGSSKPAVCSSLNSLKSSVNQLKNLNMSNTSAQDVQQKLANINKNLQQVSKDAKKQHSSEVDAIQHDYESLQTAIKTAESNPSSATIAQVGSELSTLVHGISRYAQNLGSTC